MLSRGLDVFIFQNVLLLALSGGPTRVARLDGTSLSRACAGLFCPTARVVYGFNSSRGFSLKEKGKKMVHTVESVSMFLVMATILFTSVSSHAMRPSGLRR